MLPGIDAQALSGATIDEKAMARTEAIILSMTPAEREHPSLLNSSRNKRIAAGSGTDVVDVNRLLVVTFTDAAAAEMRSRILEQLLAGSAEAPGDANLARQAALLPGAQISTVHSFCLAIIRQHFHLLGLDPAMEVMDEHEAGLLLEEILDDLCEQRYEGGDESFLALVDAYGGDRGDDAVRGLALGLLAFARGQPDADAWLDYWTRQLETALASGSSALPWAKQLVRILAGRLEYAAAQLTSALEACLRSDGPAVYTPLIAAEAENVRRVAADLGRAARVPLDRLDWDATRAALGGLAQQGRLPPARGISEVCRLRAQALRKAGWDAVESARTMLGDRSIAEMATDLNAAAPHVRALVQLVHELDTVSRARRAAAGLLDFADFEYYALRLLCAGGSPGLGGRATPSATALALRERFAAVLVDEYQDINPAQELLLRLVSDRNLFCVGDVKQSIYRFRGTDPTAFLRLFQHYAPPDAGGWSHPAAAEGPGPAGDSPPSDGLRLTLRSNFRSRRSILDAANFIFANLMGQEAAEIDYDEEAGLVSGSCEYDDAPDPDAPVELFVLERRGRATAAGGGAPDEDSRGSGGEDAGPADTEGFPRWGEEAADLDDAEREAELVGRRILAMVRGKDGKPAFCVYDKSAGRHRPVAFRDIAILMRAVHGRANRYLERLSALGIPVRAELSTGYFSAIEVETILSLLRVIDNPRQDIPLAAVLRSPVVGLDEPALADIRLARGEGDFYDALVERARSSDPLGERLAAFLHRLEGWRTDARRGPLGDLVWRLIEHTGYLAFVAGLPGGGQRQANLVALHERARQFDRFARQGLSRFLWFIEQLHEADRDLGAISDPGQGLDCVLLTSVHKAKGLEFPVVCLPDLGKQFHPGDHGDVLWHRDLGVGPRVANRNLGVKYPTVAWQVIDHKLSAEAIAEEMRVLYVALTRARERLVLSGSVRNLGRAIERWGATASDEAHEGPIPAYVVGTDRTYLDWICRALARHPSAGAALVPPGERSAAAHSAESSRWLITLIDQNGKLGWVSEPEGETCSDDLQLVSGRAPAADVGIGGDLVERALRLQPIAPAPDADLFSALDERYGWIYPAAWRPSIPAKISVTELRRIEEELVDDEAGRPIATGPAAGLRAGAGWPSPTLSGWGLHSSTLAPVRRGSLVHEIIRRLELRPGLDIAAVRMQVAAMVDRGVLPPEAGELPTAELDSVAWLFRTDLGTRLTGEGARVARELPFTMAAPVSELWPLIVPAGERGPLPPDGPSVVAADPDRVVVQGIIDCVLWGAGGPELLEFKTDRIQAGHEDVAVDRYRLQLKLYARAIAEAYGKPVLAAHLVLLTPRTIRQVPLE